MIEKMVEENVNFYVFSIIIVIKLVRKIIIHTVHTHIIYYVTRL